MPPTVLAHLALGLIVGLSIMLMLIRPRRIPEVYWIGAGAAVLVLLRLIPLRNAGRSIAEGLDVYLFLIGMMLLSELAREHGVFDWLSSVALNTADGSSARLFTLIYSLGTVVTVFMSNDATAVVLTPAILAIVRKAKTSPLPPFVLPISNPANLVVFRHDMPPLGAWLLAFAVPSILSIGVTYAIMRVLFRRELNDSVEAPDGAEPLTRSGALVLAGLGVTTVVLLAVSFEGKDLGLPTCLVGLAVTAVVSVTRRSNPWKLIGQISWETLALVAGLFILVDSLESIGALKIAMTSLGWTERQVPAFGALAAGFTVGAANNIVNNLPLGLMAGATLHAAHAQGLIARAVLIGVDLGPNLSITGSLATILWLIALRKEKLHVGFWDFFRIGVFAMPVALLASLGSTILMHELFKI